MIVHALEAVSWLLGAAIVSYQVADTVIRQTIQPHHRRKGGNR